MKVYYYIILSVLLLEWSVADVLSHDVQYCSSDVDLLYRYCAETPLPNPPQKQGDIKKEKEVSTQESIGKGKTDTVAVDGKEKPTKNAVEKPKPDGNPDLNKGDQNPVQPTQPVGDDLQKPSGPAGKPDQNKGEQNPVQPTQPVEGDLTKPPKSDNKGKNKRRRQDQGGDADEGNWNGTIQEDILEPETDSNAGLNSGGGDQGGYATKGNQDDVHVVNQDVNVLDYVDEALLIPVGLLILFAGLGYTVGRIRGVRVQRRRMQKMSQKTVSNKCEETTEKQGRKGMGACEETQTEDCGNVVQEESCERVEPQSVTEAANSLPMEWTVLYGSQIGRSHIMNEMPCQDYCATEDLGSGWGLCVVSDGAGSAANSKDASRYICRSIPVIFKGFLTQGRFIEQGCLPSDDVWRMAARQGFIRLKRELAILAFGNELDLKSLAATCMVAIYSPYGVLCTHIGDGRGGYHDANKDEWIPLFQPHKGEEANQTLFLTSPWENLGSINNVPVPESSVYRTAIDAVCLLSDGMEHATFFCRSYDETTKKYYDPNCPSPEVFNKLSASVRAMLRSGISYEEMQYNWLRYLEAGNSQIQNEPDDRTLLLAVKHLDHESV